MTNLEAVTLLGLCCGCGSVTAAAMPQVVVDTPPTSRSERGCYRCTHTTTRFVWPIKADYRIIYVATDYSQTVVGREKRDYAWNMVHTATLSGALERGEGYDTTLLRKVSRRAGMKPER